VTTAADNHDVIGRLQGFGGRELPLELAEPSPYFSSAKATLVTYPA
jgi:hypothetical protein